MTTVTTAPEAEYWLQTGWMEEPGAELGIHKPITIDRKTNLHEHRAYWCVRRAQDIFFSLLALIALSPLMLLTCIAVWIDSPGASPVFSQLRVGRNGKLFRLYKFRSMCPNAESKLNDLLQDNEMDGPVFKMKDDPRITRVGHFIRKTSIDELPQLVNILKGDMSIVGPRPALPREVAQYTPYEWQRLYVTPGLSCYWQIAPHRNQLSFDEWMALDVKYVTQLPGGLEDHLCNLPCGAVRPRRIIRITDRQSLRALPIFLQIAFRKQKTEERRGVVPLFLLKSSNHFSTAPRFALVTMRA